MPKSFIAWLTAGLPGLAFMAMAVAGPIYQCEENGRKVFSQQPCGADARVVRSANAERTVALTADISSADISYLCSLSMRSWEKQSENNRNSYSYYNSGSGNAEERRRSFMLSHIENLEQIAADDPDLYEIAKSISGRSFYGDSGSYLYDAERAKAQRACVNDLHASVERLRERRKSEDERRFGARK